MTQDPWLLWIVAAVFAAAAVCGWVLMCRDAVRSMVAVYRRRRATRALVAKIRARR